MVFLNNNDIYIDAPTSVTLGNFDGVHLAHQKLISLAKEEADQKSIKSLVFTFNPHPLAFSGSAPFHCITTAAEKRELISQSGVDFIVEYPFDKDIKETEPERFVKETLIDRINAQIISVGENYRFGKARAGNVHLLSELCKKYDIKLNIMPDISISGEIISSSAIRKHIIKKELDTAKQMLARPYFVSGTINSGKALGRSIGYPTINLEAENDKLYPSNGVYATITELCGKKHKSITNIGNRPTVNGAKFNIETHILDFDGDAYNQTAIIYFHKWIREEKMFAGISDLTDRIAIDIELACEFFNGAETL